MRFGFSHDKRSARHTFDASGNHQLCIAASDRARGLTNCFQTRSAQSIHRHRRNGFRQTGQERCHAGNIAIVFAGLIGATEDNFIHRTPVHSSDNATSMR